MLSGTAPFKNYFILKGAESMNVEELKRHWKQEEAIAHIHGWDFSHIHGRYEEEHDLPWDYKAIIKKYLSKDMELLDHDTGGGEFLLSLKHPYRKTSATEGYPPNVKLCQETLLPLGIHFKECSDPAAIPFKDVAFDMIINRHGDFDIPELYRLLKKNGIFISEQVGGENDRDLIEMVLPNTRKPNPHLNLNEQQKKFEKVGFQILQAEEAFRPITFYDIRAFVWFARILEWEFPDFSVDRCFERLLRMHQIVERDGKLTGTIHRYLIVATK